MDTTQPPRNVFPAIKNVIVPSGDVLKDLSREPIVTNRDGVPGMRSNGKPISRLSVNVDHPFIGAWPTQAISKFHMCPLRRSPPGTSACQTVSGQSFNDPVTKAGKTKSHSMLEAEEYSFLSPCSSRNATIGRVHHTQTGKTEPATCKGTGYLLKPKHQNQGRPQSFSL